MKKLVAIVIVGILFLLSCAAPAQHIKIRVLSEEYPPFNYTDEKGNFVGKSTEVVRSIMDKIGQDIPIEVMPWEQSYVLVQKEPGVALYSMAKTSERENLFSWVGPIGSYENWLYAKKGSLVKVRSLEEAKTVKKIAAVKNEAGQQVLANLGFKNFEYTESITDGLKLLIAGSVDLWMGTMDDLPNTAQNAGVNPNDLEPTVLVHKVSLFIAFNKGTPRDIVQQWQQALDSLKK